MRVLICGGRNFTDMPLLVRALDIVAAFVPITHVIQGGALGADCLGQMYAENRKIPVTTFRADWRKHGRAAGPIRNQIMLDEGKPDFVIAFPGGRGTADMVERARKAGIPVNEVKP